jgi:hypothetical protein
MNDLKNTHDTYTYIFNPIRVLNFRTLVTLFVFKNLIVTATHTIYYSSYYITHWTLNNLMKLLHLTMPW